MYTKTCPFCCYQIHAISKTALKRQTFAKHIEQQHPDMHDSWLRGCHNASSSNRGPTAQTVDPVSYPARELYPPAGRYLCASCLFLFRSINPRLECYECYGKSSGQLLKLEKPVLKGACLPLGKKKRDWITDTGFQKDAVAWRTYAEGPVPRQTVEVGSSSDSECDTTPVALPRLRRPVFVRHRVVRPPTPVSDDADADNMRRYTTITPDFTKPVTMLVRRSPSPH